MFLASLTILTLAWLYLLKSEDIITVNSGFARAKSAAVFVALLLIGFVAARVAVLAIIDASSFNGTVTGYLKTISTSLATAAIVLDAQAVVVVRGRFVYKFPWR
jgi:hypothetical protein